MYRQSKIRGRRAFTLVEIMVTMAILIIMMSFLFQYVIGAQRIFSSSNRQAIMYDDAQVVLGLLENDLRNMIVSNEPGREIPLYYYDDTGNHRKALMMVTSHNSTAYAAGNNGTLVGYYLVIYYFVEGQNISTGEPNGKLYRDVVDQSNALGTTNDPWDFIGLGYALNLANNDFTTIKNDINDVISDYIGNRWANLTTNDEVLDSISAFNITPLDNSHIFTNDHFAKVSPKAIKIEMSLYDSEKISERLSAITNQQDRERLLNENSHHFSKVVFLNDLQ